MKTQTLDQHSSAIGFLRGNSGNPYRFARSCAAYPGVIAVACFLVFSFLFALPLMGQETHGTITVGNGENVTFTMSTAFPQGQAGGGWNFTGNFDDNFNWPALCNPCFSQIAVGGTVSGNDFMGGTANFTGGIIGYYPSVNWGYITPAGPSYFQITGPNIPLPPASVGTFAGTFSFGGALCGVVHPNGQFGPCAVELSNMSGTGVVFVTIGINHIGQQYATQVVYVF